MSETAGAEKIVRSRTVSFRDIHVAKVTANTETEYAAETPTKLARAIKGKINDKFTAEKIYSDDTVEDVNMSYQGTEVELEVNSLAPQDKAKVFGHLYDKGYLIKSKDDTPPEMAMGYRAKKLNGKYEFVWLYAGRFDQGLEDNYLRDADGNVQYYVNKGSSAEKYVRVLYYNYYIYKYYWCYCCIKCCANIYWNCRK